MESSTSDLALAEAWARSTGLVHIPAKPHKFNGWICFFLAWLWFIPAIIYFFWCENTKNAYNDALSRAAAAWRLNGSPNPYQDSQVRSPNPQPQGSIANEKSSDLPQRLRELAEMKQTELISEEEYAAAKKKLLDI